jgi:hypothetical protein
MGWLEVFSREPSADNAHDWLNVLEQYFSGKNQNIDYFHWLREFPSIYILSKWLDHYIAQCQEAGKVPHDQPFNLDILHSSRSVPSLRGSGISSPPLRRVLGPGLFFLVRELIHFGVLDHPGAKAYAFVPSPRVRGLLGLAGIDVPDNTHSSSAGIYHQLADRGVDPTLKGLYDIPLDLLARHPKERERLFPNQIEDDVLDRMQAADDARRWELEA